MEAPTPVREIYPGKGFREMTHETKVGLLVGLAFIVCFGIILTHRGTGDRMSSDVALELLSRHHAASIVPQNFSFDSFYKRPESHRPPASSRWGQSANRVIRPESHQAGGATGEVADDVLPAPTWERLFPDKQVDVERTVDEGAVDPPPAAEKTNRRRQIHKAIEKPLRRAARSSYVVRAGDTMWSIARGEYGKGSRAIVDAIFTANRDRLTTADRLVVGVELALPVIE